MSTVFGAITWNIDPIIFEIGKIQIRYYGLLWGLGIYLAYVLAKKIFLNEKEDIKLLDPLLFACMIGGIVGARLGHVIFYQSELFSEDFFSVFLPFSFKNGVEFTGFAGLASHGGAAGVIIGLIWYKFKKSTHSFLWILDKVAYPIALTGSLIRIANFMNSEIIGVPTGSDFGVIFSQVDDLPRHPSQLYEAICYLLIFFFLRYQYWQKKAYLKEGKMIGLFFVLVFTARFFVEFTKNSQGGIEESLGLISTGQWLSLPFVAIGTYLLINAKKTATV